MLHFCFCLSISQESVSKHFSGDVLRVAGKCWQQIHPNISGAIEVRDVHNTYTVGALIMCRSKMKCNATIEIRSAKWQ